MGADGVDGGMDNGDGKGAEASGGTIFLFFCFFFKNERSSSPMGKGIIVPCLTVLSVFANIIALCKNKLVYSVSRILWDPFYI